MQCVVGARRSCAANCFGDEPLLTEPVRQSPPALGRSIAQYAGGCSTKEEHRNTIEGETHERTTFASVGIVLLAATAAFAQHVKTDYNRGTDFSEYKPYSWEKVQTEDPLWVDRIKGAVDAALTAKGLTPVATG